MNMLAPRLVTALILTLAFSDRLSGAGVDYTVRFPEREHNIVEVEAVISTGGEREPELFMPVWTPGSYLVREYARNVQEIEASANGISLPIEKIAKNRWKVNANGAAAITLRYRVFARELSVRTNFVEPRYAVLNGAATFITRLDGTSMPHIVRVEIPESWNGSASGMPSPAPNVYRARNYDHLVDSPIVAGTLDIRTFSVGGKPHHIVSFGDLRFADLARIASDVEAIARQNYVFWRTLPYESYWILNAMVEGRGGLEHENSTLIMTNRFLTRSRSTYTNWLETVSHEIFHVWNAKDLRPSALIEIDYESENYLTELWFTEGFTDYYGALLARRAGLMSEQEYLASLSQQIRVLQTTPGRGLQSAEQSSFDAWTRYYRPDENSPNVSISYYTKGHVMAFILDAAIRAETGGTRSLDDVMRRMWEQHREDGFNRTSFERELAEIASPKLVPLLRKMTSDTGDLDFRIALELYGLRFRAAADPSATLEAITSDSGGRLLIRTPLLHGAAWNAGLQSEDELLAIDGVRVLPGELNERLARYQPADEVELMISRRGSILTLPATLGSSDETTWTLEPDPAASARERAMRDAWLGERR